MISRGRFTETDREWNGRSSFVRRRFTLVCLWAGLRGQLSHHTRPDLPEVIEAADAGRLIRACLFTHAAPAATDQGAETALFSHRATNMRHAWLTWYGSYVLMQSMHTVCETHSFVRAAKEAGMSDSEREALVEYLAENPMAGEELQGTGGCRKVRVAGRGKGKSGGYRTITFFTGASLPVFLITVFGKGEKASLNKKESNALKGLTALIVEQYESKIRKIG